MKSEDDTHEIEGPPQRRWPRIALVLAVLSVAVVARLVLAGMARHPGHSDHVFYYTVAENIVEGRGLQIDYLWHYLTSPEQITHSSNDYWMPATSVIISLSMATFGKSLFAALVPSILAALVLSVLVYFVGKAYTGDRFVGLASAGVVLFLPLLFQASLLTDTTIYYTLFASASLLFMILGRTNPVLFLFSSALAGLAHLTRQDGLLLIPTLLVVLGLSPVPRKTRLAYACYALGLYLLVLSPLVVANFKAFGSPFSPGASKTMFLRQYEDLYTYSQDLTLASYLDWGVPNILRSKLDVARGNAATLVRSLGDFFSIFAVVGIIGIVASPDRRRRWAIYLPPLVFLAILFIFYTLVATFPGAKGGFRRSSMSIVPFLVVIAVEAVRRNTRSTRSAVVILGVVAALLFGRCLQSTRAMIELNTQIGRRLAAAKEIIDSDAFQRDSEDIVIMTRDPWEVYHTTRYKAIQTPNDEIDVVSEVAGKFRANYLLLSGRRVALEGVYTQDEPDPRFQLIGSVPNSDLRVFRIELE